MRPKLGPLQNFAEGMSTDLSPINQKSNSYRYGQNVILESILGDKNTLSSEPGNELEFNLPDGYTYVGSVNMGTKTLIFSSSTNSSEIGIHQKGRYETVVNAPCLNFSQQNPIKGLFRSRSCGDVVYFVDGFNNDRYIELDRLELHQTNGIWDCDKFSLKKNYLIPLVSEMEVFDYGGKIDAGSISFFGRYVDRFGNGSDYFPLSGKINIYDDPIALGADGGFSLASGVSAEAGGVPATSKSVELQLESIDTSFDFIEIAVVVYSSGDGVTSQAYALSSLATSNRLSYVFTGIEHGATEITLNELVVPTSRYNKSKAILALNNRLVRSNVAEEEISYAQIQQAANNLEVEYVVQEIPKGEIVPGHPLHPDTSKRGYARDEVYALALQWIGLDGSFYSPVHLPGREKDVFPGMDLATAITTGNANTHVRNDVPVAESWDTQTLTFTNGIANGTTEINEINGKHLLFSDLNCSSGTTPLPQCDLSEFDLSITYNHVSRILVISWTGNGTLNGTYKIVDINNPEVILEGALTGSSVLANISPSNDAQIVVEVNMTTYNLSGCTYMVNRYTENPLFDLGISNDFTHTQTFPLAYTPPVITDFDGCSVDRWKVHNTAIKTSATEGIPAFFETDTPYPDLLDCDGTRIFPEGNIRHHRMPDMMLEPIESGDNLYILGLRVSGIEVPETLRGKVRGYRILRSQREDSQKTVVDTGIVEQTVFKEVFQLVIGETEYESEFYETSMPFNLDKAHDGGVRAAQTGASSMDSALVALYSPLASFDKATFTGSYLSAQRRLGGEIFISAENDAAAAGATIFGYDRYHTDLLDEAAFSNPEYLHQTRQMSLIGQDKRFTLDGKSIVNDKGQPTLFISLEDPLTYDNPNEDIFNTGSLKTEYNLVSIKRNIVPYRYLQDIRYVGASDISPVNQEITFLGGDVYISQMNLRKTRDQAFVYEAGTPGIFSLVAGVTDSSSHLSFWAESPINANLRNEGLGTYTVTDGADEFEFSSQKYYPRSFHDSEIGIDAFLRLPYQIENYFSYNKDFSPLIEDNPHFPLPDNFDYCSNCGTRYEGRNIYSPVSFQDDVADNWRIHRVNDFRDIDGTKGGITNTWMTTDRYLFIHTTRSLYRLPVGTQTINASGTDIFVGNGSFMGIEENEMLKADEGFAGCQHFRAFANSELGALWVDQEAGRIYHYGARIDEVSRYEISSELKKNVPSFLRRYLDENGIEDESFFDNYGMKSSTIDVVYDQRFKRFIISKKDYKPLFEWRTTATNINDPVYFTRDGLFWRRGLFATGDIPLDFNNKVLFENKSWTVSYYPETKRWVSFHTYIPLGLYKLQDQFFSTEDGNGIHRHLHFGKFGNFYGKQSDHIVELVLSPSAEEWVLEYLEINAELRTMENGNWKYSRLNRADAPLIFDRVWVMNDETSTGILNIIQERTFSPHWAPSQLEQRITDGIIRLNGFWDLSEHDSQMASSDWIDTQDIIAQEGYIDKVPRPHQTNPNQYDMRQIHGNYAILRLYFRKEGDEQVFINTVQSIIQQTRRR